MNNINVFIYSYKRKNLFEDIVSIIENESKANSIRYYLFDQNNIDRRPSFENLPGMVYRHIPWDDTRGIPYYRKHVIFEQNSNYFLELSSDISLVKGWDEILIESLPEKSVISGNSIKKITVEGLFSNLEILETDRLSESNFIDTDLIFLKQKDSVFLNQLQNLKHYGQDLYASAMYLSRGFKIFSMSSNFYTKNKIVDDLLYYPYSKTHGYNKMIDSLSLLDNKQFEDFHSIKISNIKKMPYQIDDVLYHNPRTSIDVSASTKFHSGYSSVIVV
jgi:hypothetical protein